MAEAAPNQKSALPDRPGSGPTAKTLVVVAAVLGCLARGWLIWISPAHKAPWDHHEYVRWGIQASRQGLLSMYTSPPPESDAQLAEGRTRIHHRWQYICNYPPLAAYLFRVKGAVHGVIDPERVSNTRAAHYVYSAAAVVADLLLAWGCLAVVSALAGRRAGQVAFAVAWLAPPIMLDSCFWQQTDSWAMAPGVWMLHAMMRRRWVLAGLCWGTALALKTQGILLAPIWVFAWLLQWRRGRRFPAGRSRVGVIAGAAAGLAWLNLLALPFWLTSGSAWLQNSFVRNLRDEAPRTTLKAFNVWYLDLLLTEDPGTENTLLGVEKDTWGKGLALAGLLLAGALGWRSGPGQADRLLLFAGLWLLLVVMLPTRVHERYLLLALPFLACLACVVPRFWIGLVALLIVATFQVTVYEWMSMGAGTWPEYEQGAREYHARALEQTPPEMRDQLPTRDRALELARRKYAELRAPDRVREWMLTVLSLVGSLAVVYAAVSGRRRPPPGAEASGGLL